jgi:OmpA-OmpF porin, OOP family
VKDGQNIMGQALARVKGSAGHTIVTWEKAQGLSRCPCVTLGLVFRQKSNMTFSEGYQLMKTNQLALGLLCLSLLSGHGAMAQEAGELTAAEIEALFEAQRTRGLVLAPVAGSEEGDDIAAEAETTTVAANEDYVQIDSDLQVNIRIAFEFDSAALSAGEQAKLDTLCTVIQNSDIPLFKIIGHTDSSGADDYNQRLSQLRAEEVQRHLVNNCGISGDRLEAIGVGEAFPFDPSDPRADVNRRVEFQVGS